MGYKDKVPEYLADEERWLMGYCIARGVPRPSTIAQKFNNWNTDKVRIADNLHKIKHWKIILGSYEDLENKKATWFIDPPYQTGGYKYSCCNVDYDHLYRWANHREGQIILCENTNNSWIPKKRISNFKKYARSL